MELGRVFVCCELRNDILDVKTLTDTQIWSIYGKLYN